MRRTKRPNRKPHLIRMPLPEYGESSGHRSGHQDILRTSAQGEQKDHLTLTALPSELGSLSEGSGKMTSVEYERDETSSHRPGEDMQYRRITKVPVRAMSGCMLAPS